jgi:hypothetical protein
MSETSRCEGFLSSTAVRLVVMCQVSLLRYIKLRLSILPADQIPLNELVNIQLRTSPGPLLVLEQWRGRS